MGDRHNVRTIARGRWRDILLTLGLDERTLSGKHGPCPMCGGKDRFRFDDKDGRGTYFCSGCGAGDGVQLAVAITGLPFREVALSIEQLAGTVRATVGKCGRSIDDKLAALRRVYRESIPITEGDAAVRYLRGRGLALRELPQSLRLHPRLAYHDDGVFVATYATMLATVTSPTGAPVSLHRTYLQDGRKAPVTAPKKLMQGGWLVGAAIRLTPVSEVLGIAEGVETALACFEQFEVPTWSCLSTSGIESFEPPAGVNHIIVFGDNDANFAGQKAATAVANRLALRGYKVSVRIPETEGDWLHKLTHRNHE